MDTLRLRAATARLLTRAHSGPRPPASGELDQLAARVQAALPRYALEEPLGRGGSSVVFAAYEERLGREVALKVFADLPGSEPAARERFAREARAMAGLAHPNVVVIHDFGQAEELDWIAMERIDGVTLRQLLLDGPLDVEEFAGIALPLLNGIEFAHSRGVVHRDVKPENILLDSTGHVKVCDFGIAKWAGPQTHWQTRSGVALGTPRYLAPEQIEAPATVDERADVFALGVVLYEMLTGEVPVGHFEPPSQRTGVPEALDQVVLRAMSRKPSGRPSSVAELRSELLGALGSAPAPGAEPETLRNSALHPTSGWIDLVFFFGVFASCIFPNAIGSQSLLKAAPATWFLLAAWLASGLSNVSQAKILNRPIQPFVSIAVSLFTAVFVVQILRGDARLWSSFTPTLIFVLTAIAVFNLVRIAHPLRRALKIQNSRRPDASARKLANQTTEEPRDLQILRLWESSVGWDWIVFGVGAMTLLPGLHEDGHLMRVATIWMFFPVVAFIQVVAVTSCLDAGRSASAAAYRVLSGFLLLTFGILWAVTDGVDDLERSGEILYGLLMGTSVTSILSSIDWWKRLEALGLLGVGSTEPAESESAGVEGAVEEKSDD